MPTGRGSKGLSNRQSTATGKRKAKKNEVNNTQDITPPSEPKTKPKPRPKRHSTAKPDAAGAPEEPAQSDARMIIPGEDQLAIEALLAMGGTQSPSNTGADEQQPDCSLSGKEGGEGNLPGEDEDEGEDEAEPEEDQLESSSDEGVQPLKTTSKPVKVKLLVQPKPGNGRKQRKAQSDSESDEDAEFLDDIAYEIPFKVPYRNDIHCDLAVLSNTSFAEFRVAVAEAMEIPVSHLPVLAYVPLWKTKKPVDTLLNNEPSWRKLLGDVQSFRNECLAKNRGKGAIKEHTILLIDKLSPQGKKDGKKGTGGKKESSEEKTLGGSTQKESECLKAIEARHMCNTCHRPCYVLSTGEHHQYTMQELSTWAHMMANHNAIVNEPPEALKILDASKKKATGKGLSNLPVPAATPSQPLTSPDMEMLKSQMMMMQQMQMQQMMMSFQGAPAALLPNPTTHTTPTKLAAPSQTIGPSPSPKRPLESPLQGENNSDLATWLVNLDADEKRNRQGFQYSSLLEAMHEKALFELRDIVNLSPEKMMELLGPDLLYGYAQRIIDYASQDFNPAKRARI